MDVLELMQPTYDKAMAIYNKGDYENAFFKFGILAKQWDTEAQYMLGNMCKEPLGTTRNYIFAYMWYNLATLKGHKEAKNKMDELEKELTKSYIIKAQEYTQKWIKDNPEPPSPELIEFRKNLRP